MRRYRRAELGYRSQSFSKRLPGLTGDKTGAWVAAIFVLLAAHAALLGFVGTTPPGPFLSDCIQLAMGLVYLLAAWQASLRSGSFGRDFWRLVTICVGLWFLAQALGA